MTARFIVALARGSCACGLSRIIESTRCDWHIQSCCRAQKLCVTAITESLLLVGCTLSARCAKRGEKVDCSLSSAQIHLVQYCLLAMKLVIPGETGQISAILCRAFSHAGDEVVILNRKSAPQSLCR